MKKVFIILPLVFLPFVHPAAQDRSVQHSLATHIYIAKEAYDYYISQYPDSPELTQYIGSDAYPISGDNDASITEGAHDADLSIETPWGDKVWFNLAGAYMNHMCAGADGSEFYDGFGEIIKYYSAYEFALKYWDTYVVQNYNNGEIAKSYYYLGHVAHLLMDMCVPAHTHNDFHSDIVGDIDSYESSMTSMYSNWGYGNGSRGGPTGPVEEFDSLYKLFQQTADYVEEYDSNDEEGDDEADYPNTGDHRPDLVDRSNGIDSTEVLIIGDDLMPFVMKRVASLYRYYYSRRGYVSDLSGVAGYPNPCYLKTQGFVRIGSIPSDANDVSISIYNLAGKMVHRLTEGEGIEVQGDFKVGTWNGRNDVGQMVSSGIYIFLVKTENSKRTEKIAIFW